MVPVYNYAAYRGDCDDFSGSADPEIASQLWRRLPGRPDPVFGPLHLSAERQAQLHLRHRLPDLLYRAGQPVPGPDLQPEPGSHRPDPDLPEPLQPAGAGGLPAAEPGVHAQLDPEPHQVHRAGAGAGDLPLLPDGPDAPGSHDHRGRGQHARSVRRVHDRRDGLPVRLRQLPAERGAGQQLPARTSPGSRRSPLDLENRPQYATSDVYRNNAYGLYNRGSAGADMQFYDNGHRLAARQPG